MHLTVAEATLQDAFDAEREDFDGALLLVRVREVLRMRVFTRVPQAAERELAEAPAMTHTSKKSFAYARLLTFSGDREAIARGIDVLAVLVDRGYRPGSCLFGIAVGYYFLGELRLARVNLERLIKSEPKNEQAVTFHSLVRKRVRADGFAGLAIVAAAAAAVVCVGALARGRMSRADLPVPADARSSWAAGRVQY